MACNNGHSSHAMKTGSMVNAKQTCAGCHDAPFTVDKYIPGTGITVQNLSVRTHTFNKAQSRPTTDTVASGEPEYAKK